MTDPNVDPGKTGDGGGERSFLDGITNEELKGNEHLKAFEGKTLDDFASDFVNLKSSQPTKVESTDAYTFEFPKETEVNEAELNEFKELALKENLSAETFGSLMAFVQEKGQKQAEQISELIKAEEEEMETLKTEAGDKFDGIIAKGEQILKAAGADEIFIPQIKTNPDLYKVLKWVGEKVSEDILETGGTTKGSKAGDARPKDETGKVRLKFKSMGD